MTPEERARQQIDLLLQQSGWIVQDRFETNLATAPGSRDPGSFLKKGSGSSEVRGTNPT
jgi:hypothetical protein